MEELILAAEAVTYRLGGRDHGEYRRWLKETVGRLEASHLEVLEALRDLGGILATTNYDGLLEQVTGRPAVTWQDQARAQAVLRGGEQAILHLHGFWQEPESVVLGVRSYEQLLGAEHAQAMQQAMAAMGTLLFVGFGAGLADPNFAALRAWMGRLFKGGEYRHFRLAADGEVAALRAEHGADERVFVLGYGADHDGLAPYLRRLALTPPPAPLGAAAPSPQTRPRGPGGLPPVWNLPYASNPSFTGRDTILDALRAGLTRVPGMVHPQVIAGTGGVGKTQLAVEYAWAHRADYDAVWWVGAETTAGLHGEYAALAPQVGLIQDANQDTMVTAVRAWLEDNPRWLMIFDNADDPQAIIPLLPPAGDGHVLVTTQQEDDLGQRADLVPLDVLSDEDATQFLLARTGHTDLTAARQLADALGCLPLALEQAGAFIAQAKVITLARYLELFTQRSLELLGKGRVSGGYRHTVDTTWDLSLQRLRQGTPAAAGLLSLLAFVAPDDLPWGLLPSHPGKLPAILAAAAADEVALAEVIAALRRYSLVKVVGDGLSAHRLLQAVIRENLDGDAQQQWAATATGLLRASFPEESGDVRTWPDCQRLLPHVLAAASHTERLGVQAALEPASWLLDRAAIYLQGRAQLTQAKDLVTLVTTATGVPDEVHAEYEQVFRKLGVADTTELRVRGRADADSDLAESVLRDATGVFFSGGDQSRIRALVGSRANEILTERLAAGLVIAGTSAGWPPWWIPAGPPWSIRRATTTRSRCSTYGCTSCPRGAFSTSTAGSRPSGRGTPGTDRARTGPAHIREHTCG